MISLTRSSQRRDWKLTFLLGLPFLLISLNSRVLFSAVLKNWIDTWIYLGYFLDLPHHLHAFPKEYFGARLSWILPGYLVHQLFSPMVATYMLHIAFYSAAVISLYLILKHTVGQRAGFVTAFLMGCHYHFLEPFSCDYIDGAGITYLLLILAMVTNLIESQHLRLRLCLAGIFYGCLIYTQLFLMAYTPLIILYYFYINPMQKRRLLNLIFVILGLAGATLVLCTINYYLTGRFWFMRPLIKWTIGFAAQPNPWWQPISTWWKGAYWLLLPAIVFLGSVFGPHRKFQLFFILTVLVHVLWHTKFQMHVLNYSYYASYMLPAMFLALGSQLSVVMNILSRRQFYLFFVGIFFVSLFAYLPSINQWTNQFNLLFWATLFGIASVAALTWYKKIALCLTVLSIAIINLHGTRGWPVKDDFAFRKEAYLSIFKSVAAVQSMDPKGKSRFWYNERLPYGDIYRSVASTYTWAARLVSEEFPALTSKNSLSYHYGLNDQIFILSDEENVVEKANQNLNQVGFQAKWLDERTIEQGSIHYKITYIKVCNVE